LRPLGRGGQSSLPRPVLLGLLLFVSFGTGLLISIVGPTVPALASRLRVREDALGVVFGANFLLASATTALAGRVFDRLGPRALLPAGLIAMALGSLGEGVAPSLPLLTLAAGLGGLGIGAINVTGNATASLLYPERREGVLNALNASFGAGAFLAPLLAGLALARLGGYRPAYAAVAFLLAVPVAPLLFGLPDHTKNRGDGDDDGARGTGIVALLARRALWPPLAIGFLYLGAEIGFGGWIVTILRRATGLSAGDAAPAAAVFWLFLALGALPTAYLLRHGVASARIVGVSALLAALATAALGLAGAVTPLALAACALVGLFFAPIFPLTIAMAGRAAGTAAGGVGSATALVLVAAQIGGATLPPLQGLLLGAGPGAALAVTGVCSLLILTVQGVTSSRSPGFAGDG